MEIPSLPDESLLNVEDIGRTKCKLLGLGFFLSDVSDRGGWSRENCSPPKKLLVVSSPACEEHEAGVWWGHHPSPKHIQSLLELLAGLLWGAGLSWGLAPCPELCSNETQSGEGSITLPPPKQPLRASFGKVMGKEIRCLWELAAFLSGSHHGGCLVIPWQTSAGGSRTKWKTRVCEENRRENLSFFFSPLSPSSHLFLVFFSLCLHPSKPQVKLPQVWPSRWAERQDLVMSECFPPLRALPETRPDGCWGHYRPCRSGVGNKTKPPLQN